jgi:hypothetical protein
MKMKDEIESVVSILRAELLERGIKTFPRVMKARQYIVYTEDGEQESEVWFDITFESIPAEIEQFRNANASRWALNENIGSESVNTRCETIRYSLNLYHYWTDEEKDTLRELGKMITVSEPASEYETVVC